MLQIWPSGDDGGAGGGDERLHGATGADDRVLPSAQLQQHAGPRSPSLLAPGTATRRNPAQRHVGRTPAHLLVGHYGANRPLRGELERRTLSGRGSAALVNVVTGLGSGALDLDKIIDED